MGDSTEIAWTDSTFNPWWGCAKISPGCANCYAEAFDKRTGGDHWGAGKAPRTMSASNWNNPIKWNREAQQTGVRRRVFCGSMCDWAAVEGPASERARLWETIHRTPMLDWQLLTKRADRIAGLLPDDWGEGYANVWLGVSVEDRAHGVPRIDVLRKIPAAVRFLSCEPLLGDLGPVDLSGIGWVIVGGESGPKARPMSPEWVAGIQIQCHQQSVPFFFKQWGGRVDKGGSLLFGEEFKAWPTNHDAQDAGEMSLAQDVSRCPGVGNDAEGWREGCDDCRRRPCPGGEYTPHMAPPPIIVFECESRIVPLDMDEVAP